MNQKIWVLSILSIILIFICNSYSLGESASPKGKAKKEFLRVKSVEILRARFGSAPDNLGVSTPSEGNPEGPMSFTLGKDGEIYILDQINSRIQVFKDGKRIRTIPIDDKDPLDFKDIDLISENKIALLKRFYVTGREKTALYIIEANGKILNTISLEGNLIPDSGSVTEILIIKEGKFSGIWVQLDGRMVRVASLEGIATERISVPGKLSLNARRIFNMKKIGEITAVVYRSKEDSLAHWDPECIVYFNMAIVSLLGVWDDQKGRIFLGAFLEDENAKGKRNYANEVVVLSPELREMGRIRLLVQKAPHEVWRSIRVSSEGKIYQMAVDDRGVFIVRYDLVE
jgi:hypothetical protein